MGLYTDSNGNKKGEFAGGLDTLGRALVTQQNGANQVLYKVYDSEGLQRTYTVNYTDINIHTSFSVSGPYGPIPDYVGTRKAITSVVLPNGLAYTFQYDTYGTLTRLTLPTGAVVTYTWANFLAGENSYRYVASRTVQVDGQNSTWTFSRVPGCAGCSSTTVTVADLLGNQTVYLEDQGLLYSAKFYQGVASGTPLRQYTVDYAMWEVGDGNLIGVRLPSRVTTQLENGLTSKKEFDYESFQYQIFRCIDYFTCGATGPYTFTYTSTRGNVTEIREYDWGAGAPGALLRRTTKSYLHNSNPTYKSYNIVGKVLTSTIYDGAGVQKSQTQFEYDTTSLVPTSGAPQHDYTGYSSSLLYRGNASRVKRWRNTDGALLTTTYIYDDLGNIRSVQDPGLHTASYDYSDRWANSFCLPPSNSLAYATEIKNHLNQRLQFTYFPCTGATQAKRDENDILAGRAGTTHTYDLMNRLTSSSLPDGGQSTIGYADVPPLSSTSTTKITATQNLVMTALRDSLGRVRQTQLNSDPGGVVYVDTTYDALGRKATVSNPYRSLSDPTHGITSYEYDALGRVTKVIPPDGSPVTNHVSTVYSGNTTSVTDQAGKKRKSETDALGRLTRVWEPDANQNLVYETDYGYDVLDNLLSVLQSGSRQRTFTYSSLSQLLTASNPETGTINYTYDADGNLITKADARGITTTYTYDVLHRSKTKTYSDGTPTVTLNYDETAPWGWTVSNPVGRKTSQYVSNGSGTLAASVFSYDPMGRVIVNNQCTPLNCAGNSFPVSYSYDLAGNVVSATNGAGVTISYSYNGAVRPTMVSSSLVDGQHPGTLASGITYNPAGAMAQMSYGNGLMETRAYNNRLQPTEMRSYNPSTGADTLKLSYGFNVGTANNGNVMSWLATGAQSFSRSYSYDELNRLKTMSGTGGSCTGLSWTYDIWGNRTNQTTTGGSCPEHHPTILASNRIAELGYDAAGNVTSNSGTTYQYDAENRLVSINGGAVASYVYDAEGRRVRKTASGSTTEYVYDLSGNVVAEFQGSPSGWMVGYVYLGGSLLAQYRDSTTYFAHRDYLGSTRVLTRMDKLLLDSIDYLPFGEQISGDTGTTHKFTGKERDSETGLDYFGARYDSSSLGRFMSPDPGSAHSENPQSWNRYAYALNNPLFYIDPDGADSMSAVYWLGRVSVTFFVPTGQRFDPAGLLASLRGFEAISPNLLRSSQANIRNLPVDTGGGCLFGCVAVFNEVPVSVAISLSFNYDEKTGNITGANIQIDLDPTASFVTSNPLPTRTAVVPHPAMRPNPEISGVNIDRGVLEKLAPEQLQALLTRATTGPESSSPTYRAITQAVVDEQRRRAEEERKRQEAERKRRCHQDPKKDCAP